MNNPHRLRLALVLLVANLAIGLIASARAAPDEIVVFTDGFEKKGEVGYELHLNYAARARKTPDYAGEQPPHRVFRVMPEVVWGLAERWNFGIHVPFSYSARTHASTLDGLKLRLQYLDVIERGADSAFFYGVNYEIAIYDKRIAESRYNLELRTIVGVRQGDWKVTFNPIFNQALSRNPDGRAFEFELFGQAMRELNEHFALGLEHYASFGRLRNPVFGSHSGQISYIVMDLKTQKHFEIHLGMGHGWTGPSDKRVFKVMLGLPI